ncbi:vWA domain-containing protein [Gordonia sp. NPDC003424]
MRSENGFGIIPSEKNSTRVFAFYVVCDVSRSMWDPQFTESQHLTPISVIEDALPDMLSVLEDDPTVRDTAHLSVLAFGDTAKVVVPLTPLSDDPSIPALPRQTSTDYSAVFGFLDQQLRSDHRALQQSGLAFYTPVIFFLTDGNPQVNGHEQPESVWMGSRVTLEAEDHPFRPVVVALGIGSVSETTVAKLRSTKPVGIACVADRGVAPGDLLRAIINSIRFSISRSAGQGEFEFRTPKGMRRLA